MRETGIESAIEDAGVGLSPDMVLVSLGCNGLPPLCVAPGRRRAEASKTSFLPEEPRLPLVFWARAPCHLSHLVLLVKPTVDEGPDQGAARDTASEALPAQACVDALF